VERFVRRHGHALNRQHPEATSDDLPTQIREDFTRLVRHAMKIDRANREWLATVLDRYGWSGCTLAGKRAAESAWLIAQHADSDRAFQRRCLELMATMPDGG